jgi:hypothetical protein
MCFSRSLLAYLRGQPDNDDFKLRKRFLVMGCVSSSEMRIFAQGQGSQAAARRRSPLRRTSDGAD